ncbi:MAG: hypothetical protein K2H09_06940 [Treponemataceae bacterium]|nr:hypothetical protein [Treponemataceae bacterium]
MTHSDFLASELAARYGFVRRARGCFLYTQKGVRLTDLYQEGGRAILGWGGSAFTVFKNVLNRGSTGSFDTEFSHRIEKAVCTLLRSPRTALLFSSRQAALKAALTISPADTSFWRPWNPEQTDWTQRDVAIIAPPLPWAQELFIVAAKPELVEVARAAGRQPPDGERLPAPLQAAITRAIYDLIAALQTRGEKDWFLYDSVLRPYWTRRGPYLFPNIGEAQYPDFLRHCLDCGIVISPDCNTPSIVPFGAAPGVFTKLKRQPFPISTAQDGGAP